MFILELEYYTFWSSEEPSAETSIYLIYFNYSIKMLPFSALLIRWSSCMLYFKFVKGTWFKSYESINSFFGKMEEKTVKRRCGADVLLFSHWFNCLYCMQGGRVVSALDLYSTGCMGSINSRSHHWLALFFGSAKFNPWATLLNTEHDLFQLLVVASSKNR